MTTHRIKDADYTGNQQYKGTAGQHFKYCFRCERHRLSQGGKMLTKLRLFHCVECAAKSKLARGE